MGPPPFRFTPSSPEGFVEGPAFSRPFKLLATAIVGGCGFWLAQLWSAGAMGGVRSSGMGWFLAGMALMAWTWFSIMTSRTRLDEKGLHQRWIWDKHMALGDLAFGKMIRVRGLDWLIAPRLYVRTLVGKFAVFYAASPELLAEFERLVEELRKARAL